LDLYDVLKNCSLNLFHFKIIVKEN